MSSMTSPNSLSVKARPSLEAEDPVLTVQEVAAWLRVKPSWVTAHAARRRRPYLPCFKAGRYPRFLRSAVRQFIEELSKNRSNI